MYLWVIAPLIALVAFILYEFKHESANVIVRRAKGTDEPLRVCIIGGSGAGKSTLASQLAAALRLEHIELDAIHWQPGWIRPTNEEFHKNIEEAISKSEERIKNNEFNGWVADGNHKQAKEIFWTKCTTVVWLDYSWTVITLRLAVRTVLNLIFKRPMCNGNYESFKNVILNPDAPLYWVKAVQEHNRREFPRAFEKLENMTIYRLRTPQDCETWIKSFTKR
jgi:adenylate kinase family enzyme